MTRMMDSEDRLVIEKAVSRMPMSKMAIAARTPAY